MKNKFKLLCTVVAAFMLVSVLVSSCSKNTDPANTDFFVGTYSGTISYNDGSKTINDQTGKVTVVKVGNSYSFKFGSGIPDINNVTFEKSGDNTYISVGSGVTGITIDAHTLKIGVSNSNGNWTANCTR